MTTPFKTLTTISGITLVLCVLVALLLVISGAHPVKKVAILLSAPFGIFGLLVLGWCWYLSVALGGLTYGDFMYYSWLGWRDGELVFADWPTGERPAFTNVPAWWLGGGSLFLAGIIAVSIGPLHRLKPIRRPNALQDQP